MNQLQRIEGGRRLAGLRLAGAAWRAFGPAAALIELLLVVAISIGCGVAWHVAFHDAVGDLLNFAALGAVVALIFISRTPSWAITRCRSTSRQRTASAVRSRPGTSRSSTRSRSASSPSPRATSPAAM